MTQEVYKRVMENNPSKFPGDPKRPVEQVTWADAAKFCQQLSELPGEKRAKRQYRLPTEAQWEYACRAGNPGAWFFSPQPGPLPAEWAKKALSEYAWFNENAGNQTHAVGQKRANVWGLYDMYGNGLEWCQDWYDQDFYARSPPDDPQGPSAGAEHAARGGDFHGMGFCRSASRCDGHYTGVAAITIGIRVSLVPAE